MVEAKDYHRTYHIGPEMQMFDINGHPDAKIYTHHAGDLYDFMPCSEEIVKSGRMKLLKFS